MSAAASCVNSDTRWDGKAAAECASEKKERLNPWYSLDNETGVDLSGKGINREKHLAF